MANINGKTIPGGVDWSGISNALYNTLQAPYNYRQNQLQTQPGGDNYIDPDDRAAQADTGMSFATDNEALNGADFYSNRSQGQQAAPPNYPLNAAGSIIPNKDQSRLPIGQAGQAFTYSPPNAAPVAAPLQTAAGPNWSDYFSGGGASLLQGVTSAIDHGLARLPPASVLRALAPGAVAARAPTSGLAAMPSHTAAPQPDPVAPIASTNGYTYAPNGSGGYTQVGKVNPNLTPSQQYNQAAARALASQPDPYMNNNHSGSSNSSSGGTYVSLTHSGF